MEGRHLGVRKGAWTEEEDLLLKKCIQNFGEGKWHQVPLRAGLNRCRKSCRLRWLNYLRPNIKKGKFTVDEVDLILRLHKLLGNRWSLISGRLPGRTANDVKNYWNTHLRKKLEEMIDKNQNKTKVNVIKPQPRTFSKTLPWILPGKPSNINNNDNNHNNNSSSNHLLNDNILGPSLTSVTDEEDGQRISWWKSLASGNCEIIDKTSVSSVRCCEEGSSTATLWTHEIAPSGGLALMDDFMVMPEFPLDTELRKLLSAECWI